MGKDLNYCLDFEVDDIGGADVRRTCDFCRHVKTDASGQAYCGLDEGDDDE